MKISAAFLTLTLALFGLTASADAGTTPLHVVEKASHYLMNMIKKGQAPAYLSADLSRVIVRPGKMQDGTPATEVVLYSESQNAQDPNWVRLYYSTDLKVLHAETHAVSANPQGPLFTKVEGARLLDWASEVVVDNLTGRSGDVLQVVADTSESIDIQKNQGVLFSIRLKDSRIYKIQMDLDGNLISQGF